MIFDVNTEDDTQALTGPPICFLEEKVMHHVVKLLKPNGKFSERVALPYSNLEVFRIILYHKCVFFFMLPYLTNFTL